MTILDEIVEYKKKEVSSCKEIITLEELQAMPDYKRPVYSFSDFITREDKTGIIAEFKRQSPSKGIINDKVSVEEVTSGYARSGASALSVLTDFNFFGGSVDDLQKARAVNQIPILRKEFIIDAYQIYEAKAIGADAILLIAAILSKEEVIQFSELAHQIGLEVLMEIHADEELEKICDSLDVVGVNNRNLKTFEVDLEHSKQLVKKIPDQFIKISESGISSTDTIHEMKKAGFQGFLIGENFMKTSNPGYAFQEFVTQLSDQK